MEDYSSNARKLIATYLSMWQQKYNQPLDLDFFLEQCTIVCWNKMRDEIKESIDFLSLHQLSAVVEELSELCELKKKPKDSVTKEKQWKKPKSEPVH